MEEIIRKIVDADKQARARVKQKQQERHNIQNLIQDQSMEIREKYRKETEDCIAKKREQMDADLQNAMQQEEAAYEESLNALQQKYEEHKEEWVSQIVKRTLAM